MVPPVHQSLNPESFEGAHRDRVCEYARARVYECLHLYYVKKNSNMRAGFASVADNVFLSWTDNNVNNGRSVDWNPYPF